MFIGGKGSSLVADASPARCVPPSGVALSSHASANARLGVEAEAL